MSNNILKRDSYIDFVKGICAIAVVFIHTVYFSGDYYIPEFMHSICLFVDVPIFFFMCGCALSLKKSVAGVAAKQIFKLGVAFAILVAILQILSMDFDLKRLISPLLLIWAEVPLVPLVSGSYWFVPVYAVSLVCAEILIINIDRKYLWVGVLPLILIFYLITWRVGSITNMVVFGQFLQNIPFFSGLMVLGYLTYKKYTRVFPVAVLVTSVSIILFLIFVQHVPFYLQRYKLPVTLPYVSASMISIALILIGCGSNIILSLSKFRVYSFVSYVGKNAIFAYMGQAIGGSILYAVVNLIHLPWVPKMFVMFIINLSLSIFFAVVLNLLFKCVFIVTKRVDSVLDRLFINARERRVKV